MKVAEIVKDDRLNMEPGEVEDEVEKNPISDHARKRCIERRNAGNRNIET